MPPEVQIATVNPEPIRAAVLPLVARAKTLKVSDIGTHAQALAAIRDLRHAEKEVAERFEPTRAAFDKAKKELLALRDGILRPIEEARAWLSSECDTYENEQRRIAVEEARRIAEEQRKREDERKLQDAILAEADGHPEEADAILNETPLAPVVHVAPAVAKVEGISARTLYGATLADPREFIRWLAEHTEETAMVERAALACGPLANSMATRQREAFALPGWHLKKDTSRAVRSA